MQLRLPFIRYPEVTPLQVAEEIKKIMEGLGTRFPQDMEYRVSLDTTLPIEVGHYRNHAYLVGGRCPGDPGGFFIPAGLAGNPYSILTVPVSLIGVFIFFPLLGFSVNVLSLLGLVLGYRTGGG